MPAFVVLSHTFPKNHEDVDHFDLMIQDGQQLATWRLVEWPPGEFTQSIIQLPPHRIAYLDYEGPITMNRGEVIRVERGLCQIESQSHLNWLVVFQSESFAGKLLVAKAGGKSAESNQQWTMTQVD